MRYLQIGLLLLAPTLPAQQYVIAGPADLVKACESLSAHRAAQGLDVSTIALAGGSAEGVRAELRDSLQIRTRPGYLLLVGDAQDGGLPLPSIARPMPSNYHFDRTGLSKGRYFSDLGYVDPNADGIPEWACGRIPVSTPAEAKVVVDKILAYETGPSDAALWENDITLIANSGNFGKAIDAILENAIGRLFREDLDPRFRFDGVVGIEGSPFFTEPSRFLDSVIEAFDAGPFAVVYAGHGWPGGFAPIGAHRTFDNQHVSRLSSASRSIFIGFSCHLGNFPCRAANGELLLRAAAGPCAVIGASEVSFAYGDLLLGHEIMRRLGSDSRPLRIGDVLCDAKRAMMQMGDDHPLRRQTDLICQVAGLDEVGRDGLRLYTSYLYQLLGDPAMVLRMPRRIMVQLADGKAQRGADLAFMISAPAESRPTSIKVELCMDRGKRDPGDASSDVVASRVLEWKGDVPLRVTFPPNAALKRHGIIRVTGSRDGQSVAGGLRFRLSR